MSTLYSELDKILPSFDKTKLVPAGSLRGPVHPSFGPGSWACMVWYFAVVVYQERYSQSEETTSKHEARELGMPLECMPCCSSDSGHSNGHPPAYDIPRVSSIMRSPEMLPQGLILIDRIKWDDLKNTGPVRLDFEYPDKLISAYDVPELDWRTLMTELNASFRPDGEYTQDLTGRMEYVLDTVAEWDLKYFRPRGLVFRMDMPGEIKYGLTFMDIFECDHIHNLHGLLSHLVSHYPSVNEYNSTCPKEEQRQDLSRWRSTKSYKAASKANANNFDKLNHLSTVLWDGWRSVRLVFDDVSVLRKRQLSVERGWTAWLAASEYATQAPRPVTIRTSRPVQKPAPKVNNSSLSSVGILSIPAPAPVPAQSKKFDRTKRGDRWPPSKHLYFDHYRANHTHVAANKNYMSVPEALKLEGSVCECYWLFNMTRAPKYDSIDQRSVWLSRSRYLPADVVPNQVFDFMVDDVVMGQPPYWKGWALEILERDGYFDDLPAAVGLASGVADMRRKWTRTN